MLFYPYHFQSLLNICWLPWIPGPSDENLLPMTTNKCHSRQRLPSGYLFQKKKEGKIKFETLEEKYAFCVHSSSPVIIISFKICQCPCWHFCDFTPIHTSFSSKGETSNSFSYFFLLLLYLGHIEVPMLGVQQELQLQAYATPATRNARSEFVFIFLKHRAIQILD